MYKIKLESLHVVLLVLNQIRESTCGTPYSKPTKQRMKRISLLTVEDIYERDKFVRDYKIKYWKSSLS